MRKSGVIEVLVTAPGTSRAAAASSVLPGTRADSTRKRRAPTDLHGVLVALALSAGLAHAQVPEDAESAIETIEVVGSNMRGLDPEGILPVLVVNREDIARTGVISVAEVLQQLPFDNAGSVNDREALTSALGGAGISFRGLGANAVLVLINGRRAAPYGFSRVDDNGGLVSFIDLNSVPVAAVERIEVLKDGASAIYGSDAMAGVINIVLREDFTGSEFELRYGNAEDGADEQSFNALLGWEIGRANVELIATHTSREQLFWRDREISASANHEAEVGVDLRSFSADNIWIDGIGYLPGECEARNASTEGNGFVFLPEYGVCLFDPNTEIVVPSAERTGLTTLVDHELNENLQLHLEASYLLTEARGRRDPVSWSDGLVPASNPWNPFGEDVFAEYRFTETGPRIDVVETDSTRFVAALEGQRGAWSWDFSIVHHGATTDDAGSGYLDGARIEEALNGIDLNADGVLQQDEYLNLFSQATYPNSAALTNSILAKTLRKAKTKLTSYKLRAARPLLKMLGGDLFAAFGIERRNESLDDDSDPLSIGSLLAATAVEPFWLGLGIGEPRDEIDPYAHIEPKDWQTGPLEPMGYPASRGSRGQNALFSELRIPFIERAELQVALRYDDIGRIGHDWSPRLALRFTASSRLRVRASWGQGFRAPSLAEMYSGPSTKQQYSWDPKRCPAYPGWVIPEIAGGCVVQTFVTASEGNPDLEPEHSESASAGIDVDIFDKHRLALDCWKIDIKDKILSAQTAWVIRHEDDLPPGFVIRDPLTGIDQDIDSYHDEPVGMIAWVNLLPLNFGRQKVDGCDVELSTVWNRSDGSFEAQLLGTHMASNKLALNSDDALEELAGSFGFPRNRANLNLFWSHRDWRVGLYGRWTDRFADTWDDREVGSHTEWDTQLTYTGLGPAALTLGVENVFDEPPPLSVGSFHPQGFPVQFYDMRGRFVYAQVNLSFGQVARTVR